MTGKALILALALACCGAGVVPAATSARSSAPVAQASHASHASGYGLSERVAWRLLNKVLTRLAYQGENWYIDQRGHYCYQETKRRVRCTFNIRYSTDDDPSDQFACGAGYVYYKPGYSYGYRLFFYESCGE